jgi:hypothetical protein
MIFITHCLKITTKNLWWTTKMIYLCKFSSWVIMSKSQWMIVINKFSSSEKFIIKIVLLHRFQHQFQVLNCIQIWFMCFWSSYNCCRCCPPEQSRPFTSHRNPSWTIVILHWYCHEFVIVNHLDSWFEGFVVFIRNWYPNNWKIEGKICRDKTKKTMISLNA